MRFGAYAGPYLKPDPEAEKQALKNEADALQSELNSIKKRLEEIESKTAAQ
jgi:predicted nuclease with TOPRIM domain